MYTAPIIPLSANDLDRSVDVTSPFGYLVDLRLLNLNVLALALPEVLHPSPAFPNVAATARRARIARERHEIGPIADLRGRVAIAAVVPPAASFSISVLGRTYEPLYTDLNTVCAMLEDGAGALPHGDL